MKAPPFTYHAPQSIADAVALLGHLENARVLAGGQSLMAMLNLRVAGPDHLVDLGRIPELAGITENETTIGVGAMTTQRAVERSELVARFCPLLAEAVAHVGHQQTRNRGTIGGSICHLDPGAELPVVACALDAELIVEGVAGTRQIAFRDFPEGYLTSQLQPDEILTRVDFPKVTGRTGSAFLEFNRRPADFAIVSVAVQIALDDVGRIARAAIAFGGIQSAPVRLAEAEALLTGRVPDAQAWDLAAQCAATLDCDGDELYPADYRRDLCAVLLTRALRKAVQRAGECNHV
ncbi:MAG: molybdopterin dehydrogenase [Hyphomicrobiales bacterium]|nr:molybdopterin dehydrogenase [Hyphomicrobiales bacterium]